MSTNFSRKKIISLLSPVLLGLLSMQAQAQAQTQAVPSALPIGWTAKPPYILVPSHNLAQPQGINPSQINVFYNFSPSAQGAGQTIAIVDAYDNPNVEADLGVFSAQFGLPSCTTANGCFKKIFASGVQPPTDQGWGTEIALDVEWAHAVAPLAKIILVEGADASQSLYDAVAVAFQQKPSVVSLSWGGEEFAGETQYDSMFQNSGIPVFAASGDNGSAVIYPSASPYVVAVGGTQVTMGVNGNYISETGWFGSGGGLSGFEKAPAFQTSYVIPQSNAMRGVPDVSYNASPFTPYSVYDTFLPNGGGWILTGGTSAGTPQWAALVADMKGAKKGNFANFNASIYSVAREYNFSLLHDITTGSNGACGYYCNARSGYDYVTGVGSPQVNNLINRFD
jgi:subtilase family serine protease